MTKYSISKGQGKEDVLRINGVESICPYIQPLHLQGQYAERIMQFPCNTQCPHAKIASGHYQITCSGSLLQFKLEEAEAKP